LYVRRRSMASTTGGMEPPRLPVAFVAAIGRWSYAASRGVRAGDDAARVVKRQPQRLPIGSALPAKPPTCGADVARRFL
jgi:hypothetical protein